MKYEACIWQMEKLFICKKMDCFLERARLQKTEEK